MGPVYELSAMNSHEKLFLQVRKWNSFQGQREFRRHFSFVLVGLNPSFLSILHSPTSAHHSIRDLVKPSFCEPGSQHWDWSLLTSTQRIPSKHPHGPSSSLPMLFIGCLWPYFSFSLLSRTRRRNLVMMTSLYHFIAVVISFHFSLNSVLHMIT
jgi:hypothetical protein